MPKTKKVFISHPFSGDPLENKEKAHSICKFISSQTNNIIPISPLHLFSFLDSDEGVREPIMEVCFHMIKGCDELWSFGKTKGCKRELAFAKDINIEVKEFDVDVKGGALDKQLDLVLEVLNNE